ncbi:hypothetical protein BH11MYX3_BH11MYX3_13200 [soil metagenome]
MKLAIALLAGLLGVTSIASADDAPPRQDRGRAEIRQLLLQRFDQNGDGRLEGRERKRAARALRRMAKQLGNDQQGQAGRGGRRAKLIQKYDLDHDGNLGPGELPPRVQQRMRRMDRNRDGWVDQGDRP